MPRDIQGFDLRAREKPPRDREPGGFSVIYLEGVMKQCRCGGTCMSLTVRAYHRPKEKGKLYLLAQLAQAKGYSLFAWFVPIF